MQELHPLRFQPILRRYLWGGRRLGEMLGKAIGEGEDYAESWEIVDHVEEQSVVGCGPLEGVALHQLVADRGKKLFGRHAACEQFPLLFKFLDCQRDLSVQVHPNDEQAATQDPPDLGKTEAWVVMHADPGSLLYAGLKEGVTRPDLERAVAAGQTAECLNPLQVQAGDCVYVPAGTVHALGAGLVVAEIQQASNTTFRLFDWNRVGADGKPRPLHVQQALDVIDYDCGPASPQVPVPLAGGGGEQLVSCDKFVLERLRISDTATVGGGDRFCLLAVVSGEAHMPGDPAQRPLRAGETMLLPACLGEVVLTVSQPSILLAMYLP